MNKKALTIVIYILLLSAWAGTPAHAAKRLFSFELQQLSDLVIKGEVTKVSAQSASPNDLRRYATVEVIEVIKGQAQASITIEFIMKQSDDSAVLVDECRHAVIAEKDKGIFYLKKLGKKNYVLVTPCEESFEKEPMHPGNSKSHRAT